MRRQNPSPRCDVLCKSQPLEVNLVGSPLSSFFPNGPTRNATTGAWDFNEERDFLRTDMHDVHDEKLKARPQKSFFS